MTEAYKLVRKNAPSTSVEAAENVNTMKLENTVLQVIKKFGRDGCISDQVQQILHWLPYSSVTARFSALSNKELIYFTGEKRKGRSGRNQRVMTARGI
mgnify:CR=1 FL=1|tara:strand:+ start:1201 stop:1494 length:294 start_codon:yes stop_codon:yes gene_type:complete